jgi:diacylglycerol kinase
MIAAVVLNVSLIEWCTLVVCIGVVLAAELFNTAIECLAKAITREFDDHVRDALDIASSAVLLAAVAASVVGVTIFAFRLGVWMGWWAEYLLI